MKTIELYQRASTGKIKHLIITADGNTLTTEWFTTADGKNDKSKAQTTSETVKGKNAGRANATTDEEQCLAEFTRKVTKKIEEGYVKSLGDAVAKDEKAFSIDLPLPAEFAPSKAISKTPENPTDGTWLAERKYNGVCLILHETMQGGGYIYTRRMKDITQIVSVVPDVFNKAMALPSGTIVVGELVAIDKNGVEDTRKLKGITSDKTTREKAAARYAEMIAEGYTVEFKPYEPIFFKGNDVSGLSFEGRNNIIADIFCDYKRELFTLTEKKVAEAKKNGWEGFIIRKKDMPYGYVLNGKPKRQGGYKYKFLDTTDCVVTKIAAGSGKHEVRFARFYLAQYENGKLVGAGWAGLGTLGEDRADEITKELKAKGYTVTDTETDLDPADYFAVEIEYQSRQKVNKEGERCFEFPIIQRIRFEKPLHECEYEPELDEE